MKLTEMSTEDQLRKIAHRAVAKALFEGRLVRPQICDGCGNPGPKSSDGRATIHGHHYDANVARPVTGLWLMNSAFRGLPFDGL